jgi:hypothetical protein
VVLIIKRKVKPITLILAVLLVTASIALLPRFFSKQEKNVRAGRPEVKGSSDSGYEYEFEGGSFKLFLGELAGNPNLLVKQGTRELEVTLFEGNQSTQIEQNNTEQTVTTPEESISPTPDLVQSPTPIPSEDLNLPAGLEKINKNILDEFSIEVNAQTGSPAASPSANIELVATDTEQFVEYINEEFKVEPELDTVNFEVQISEGEALPTLYFSSPRYHLENADSSIIVQTRTNRHAYSLQKAVLTDANGETIDVKLESVEAGQLDFIVSFSVDEAWLTETQRLFPLTLTYELASLFHERMLAVFPSKLNYKAFEPLIFEIDTAILADSEIQSALLSNNLGDLKFGTIDAEGKQNILDALVTESNNGVLILELRPKPGEFKPGIFDLLIQYQDHPAYIAEEDFTWGVLAINPDMSVYPVGAIANIDMAVLDKYGEMICDADLLLTITAPDGTNSERSTLDGTVTVSDTCESVYSDVPDYSTSYQTTDEGEYLLTLSALTDGGSFVIDDRFSVDSNSPFYVRRTGPTRIYPVLEYEMELEVRSATDSGTYIVEERRGGWRQYITMGGGICGGAEEES